MFRFTFVIAALATAGSQAANAVEPPLVLEPSSAWHIDYDDEKCRLTRTFGEAENTHLLYLDMAGPAMAFDMTVAGPGFVDYSDNREVLVSFGTNEPFVEDSYFIGSIESFGPALIMDKIRADLIPWGQWNRSEEKNIAPAFPILAVEPIGSSERITITQERETPVVFATGEMRGALVSLNDCVVSFIEHWGLDLAKHRTATRLPEWANMRSIVRRILSSYPSSTIRGGEQGNIQIRVIIDERGQVTECHQLETNLREAVKSPLCPLMEDARFEPALDAQGQPMRSYFLQTIRYTLP